MDLQPFLHDLLAAVHAPTQAWSAADGQVRLTDGRGAQGVYHGDVRVLAGVVLTVDGAEPEAVGGGLEGPGEVRAVLLPRGVDGPGADPTTRLERRRRVRPGLVTESLTLSCATVAPVTCELRVELRPDGTAMDVVKSGAPVGPSPVARASAGIDPHAVWDATDEVHAEVTAPLADVTVAEDGTVRLAWQVTAHPGNPVEVAWHLAVTDTGGVVQAPARTEPEWSRPQVVADDRRVPALLGRALSDLGTLRLATRTAPEDVFLAAGAPWFFTLFGRDSLWAARMLLPLGTDLAAGTLRTLAARQGTRTDPATAEQPGKILHEVRRATLTIPGEGTVLPPVYYGTVDATALWVCLLHDAWRWGMPTDQVAALLPHLEAALGWMADHGDADGDGFLEYVDLTGTGLANQGWKDSGDSVQWRTGELAAGPIALAEVQGYAHEAAIGGAALLDAFGRPGADRWRVWAGALADRFRTAFWVTDADGAYPAIALDADKRAVDTVTSNIGHLLGTGLLTAAEESEVAARLVGPDMDSGYGLRTMSARSAGYWPLRYHGGAVWPHDTAVVVRGLARSGHAAEATRLAEGLLAAAQGFDHRLPELYSGDVRGDVPAPVPYPAACRPQAWSAAAAVCVLDAALGLTADLPGGTLDVAPPAPAPLGALDVRGLRIGGHDLDVAVAADGGVRVRTDAPVRVRTR